MVFEECIVGSTWVRGFDVLDYREEAGVELVEKAGNTVGIFSAIDDVVLAAHHHVEVSYDTLP